MYFKFIPVYISTQIQVETDYNELISEKGNIQFAEVLANNNLGTNIFEKN